MSLLYGYCFDEQKLEDLGQRRDLLLENLRLQGLEMQGVIVGGSKETLQLSVEHK